LPPLLEEIARFLAGVGAGAHGMVLSVSGGPDSMALACGLLKLRPWDCGGPLVIAHLNHGLRGPESEADEEFVRRFSAAKRAAGVRLVEFSCQRIDVAARARESGGNLESTGRRLRYEWLGRVARQHGVRFVATGHTADDQAETVLHRLLRGSGIHGLQGIRRRRRLSEGVELVRPLLGVTRVAVLGFLQAEGQPFREDSSNQDLRFTRNRIRHQLLPHLAANYNPAIVDVLCRLADAAGSASHHREAQAAALLRAAELPRAGTLLVFDRRRLAAAPRGRVREALRLVWNREGWPLGGMTFRHWDRLAAVALGELPAADFPGAVRACCRDRVVQLGRGP
jgi:tRNA(Ile)-lysidine synthase